LVLRGDNGCGKSSIIKAILKKANPDEEIKGTQKLVENGILEVASGLKISYINQDTSFLSGNLKDYCKACGFEESLFLAILNQLDFSAVQFSKNMEDFSEGQKKKVLIASSLITPAHLYIWDEPLNYIDVFSRMQIEKLILDFKPTMLIVEHDVRFQEKVATEIVSF
jgi:lincosamide and streptogramin A transport system ATP-binding/permease protein